MSNFDIINRSVQLNPNNVVYWLSRGLLRRPDNWMDAVLGPQLNNNNRANQLNPNNFRYWLSRNIQPDLVVAGGTSLLWSIGIVSGGTLMLGFGAYYIGNRTLKYLSQRDELCTCNKSSRIMNETIALGTAAGAAYLGYCTFGSYFASGLLPSVKASLMHTVGFVSVATPTLGVGSAFLSHWLAQPNNNLTSKL